MSLKKGTAPRIGFIIDWTQNYYFKSLIKGMEDEARKHRANLLVFVGGALNSPRAYESPRNIIYDLINTNNVDALIISSGAIGNFCSQTELNRFCENFYPLPVINLSISLPGIPSVVINGKKGMYQLLEHLIDYHGCSRLLFIGGPEKNQDALERLDLYRNFLRERGLTVDERLILYGDFTAESAKSIILEYFKEPPEVPQVIIAANDNMAFGILEALHLLGMKVPSDIGVTGFDDFSHSGSQNPPLTTVKQPFKLQGIKAVKTVIKLINNQPVPEKFTLDTFAVIRESCGCPLTSSTPYRENETFISETFSTKVLCEKILKRAAHEGFFHIEKKDHGLIRELVHLYSTALNEKREDFFINGFQVILEKRLTSMDKVSFWNYLLTLLRTSFKEPTSSTKKTITSGDIWYSALDAMNSHMVKLHNRSIVDNVREQKRIQDLNEVLSSKLDMNEISAILLKELPGMGIKRCYLSVYEEDTRNEKSLMKLIFGFNEKGAVTISPDEAFFSAGELFPAPVRPVDRGITLYVEPLFWGSLQVGTAIFELREVDSFWSGIIRRIFVNTVLKGSIFLEKFQVQALNLEKEVQKRTTALTRANELLTVLYNERQKAEQEVRILNNELEKRVALRTSELELANNELRDTLESLKNTKDKLLHSEKMAALGGLVAGIAHEINTPLGISVTAASHLKKLTRDLSVLFTENNLKKTDLSGYIETSVDASEMVLTNLQRAYELLSSFKKIAIDQSTEELRKFNLKNYLNEILLSLKPKLKKTNHSIGIHCSDELYLISYPGAFAQVITNLVMNSLMHGYEPGEKGRLLFEFSESNGFVHFSYSDDGKGVSSEILNKIFDPFFTTKRNQGGTGLGLNILYNLVTGSLQGSVECVSKPAEGVCFKIVIPKSISKQ